MTPGKSEAPAGPDAARLHGNGIRGASRGGRPERLIRTCPGEGTAFGIVGPSENEPMGQSRNRRFPCQTIFSMLHGMRPQIFLVLVLWSVLSPLNAADWPRWRGPLDTSSAESVQLPSKLDESTLAWKVALPGKGCSTPVVAGDRIYLTAPIDGRDALIAYDLEGKLVWQAVFGEEEAGKHRNGSGSNPSPVTDGERVYVAFKSGTLAAVNVDGTVAWKTQLVERFGPVNLFWDFGSSPVLTSRNLVMARMHNGDSWLAAFDKKTGELRWKTARNYEVPREVDNGYTTPVVFSHAGQEALLSWGAEHLTVHGAADGKLLWSCGGFNPAATPLWPAVASPVLAGDIAVVCFGRADKGAPRLHGVRLGVTGDAHLWKREDVSSFVPSPAAAGGRVYVLGDRGLLACVDPATGAPYWTAELPKASSNYYASPLLAGGLIYAAREDGVICVGRVGAGFELVSENKIDDRIIAGLVPAGNRVLVRGMNSLACFGK